MHNVSLCVIIYEKEVIIIKDRIKQVRKGAGLTQTEFGERIGAKKGTIVCYESGARNPLPMTIKAISREFGISEDWLITGEGEMKSPMSREQEIAQITADLYDADPDGTMYKFMKELSKLKPETWKDIGNFISKVASRSDEHAE